ncbi:MAG: MFS transporter [Legionellaceae bacterium]|nr:MFS transporter [Legionellaceae bacterium]
MFFTSQSNAEASYATMLHVLKSAENEDLGALKHELQHFELETPDLNVQQQTFTTMTPCLGRDDRLDNVNKLITFVLHSKHTCFYELYFDLKNNHETLFMTYIALQHKFFPELGFDKEQIFEERRKRGQSIKTIIPPQFRSHIEAIEKVKGTPSTNLIGPIVSYGIGFAPYILGGIVAKEMINLSEFSRLTLAAAPTLLGGFLRFWVAHKTDQGQGKRAVMTLLNLGLIGLFGLFNVISFVKKEHLETISANDSLFWLILALNILSGAGVANYSASLPNSARAAPDDSPAIWCDRLHMLADIKPTSFDMMTAWILRKGPAGYMGIVAGIGSLTPSITLISSAFLLPEIGLSGVYAVFGAITLAGTLGTYYLLQDSIQDQLRHDGIHDVEASHIAAWMGQKLQSTPSLTYLQRLQQLNRRQKQALFVACFNYTTTFGILLASTSTASLTLSRRGMDPHEATLYAASISGISSSIRALMGVPNFPITSATITNISMATMAITSLFFALSEEQSIWLPMLLLFSVANGAGNYGVFAQISDSLSEIVGLASGLAGGVGACTAFLISLAFASIASMNKTTGTTKEGIEQTDRAIEYLLATAFCITSLILNLAHNYSTQKTQHVAVGQQRDDDENQSYQHSRFNF